MEGAWQGREHRTPLGLLRVSSKQPRLRNLLKLVETHASHPAAKQELASQLDKLCEIWREIRRLLIDFSAVNDIKDEFRLTHGFESILNGIKFMEGCFLCPDFTEEAHCNFFELLKEVLGVLSESIFEHHGNREYFACHIAWAPDGWKALEQNLLDLCLDKRGKRGWPNKIALAAKIIALLFAFAMRDETMTSMFRDLNLTYLVVEDRAGELMNIEEVTTTKSLEYAKAHLGRVMSQVGTLWNPEIIPIIVKVWEIAVQNSPADESEEISQTFSVHVLLALSEVCASSERNARGMQRTGITSTIMLALTNKKISMLEQACLEGLALNLLTLGLPNLDDVAYLFDIAPTSDVAAKLLLKASRLPKQPSHFLLDFSLHGYAAAEFTALDRCFPPSVSSTGYSFMTWFRINKFDDVCHTTIFGTLNADQSWPLLVYVECGSRQLVLQTSVSSQQPESNVRFKSTTFARRTWYHVAIVHQRPHNGSCGSALLFVNGKMCEQVKCHYPDRPGTHTQAFFGTPHDLSPLLGSSVISLEWALASAHLFAEAVHSDFILLCQKLGPAYHGNFQDCFGSFRTYLAATTFSIQRQQLLPAPAAKSTLPSIFQPKTGTGTVNPERNIILSLFPSAVFDNDRVTATQNGLLENLSKDSVRALRKQRDNGVNGIILNAAIPSISKAISKGRGLAILTGGAFDSSMWPLDLAAWRYGGCVTTGLVLLEKAQNTAAVIRALSIFFELIRDSWRNSEAMERENGYDVLAMLLRKKVEELSEASASRRFELTAEDSNLQGSFTLELLKIIMTFVCENFYDPEEAIIIVPLAYKTLVVDSEIWCNAEIQTQSLYYRQFDVLARRSHHRAFNVEIMNRVRIVKRLVDILKDGKFAKQILATMAEVVVIMLKSAMSAEIFQCLALYITYAIYHDPHGTAVPKPESLHPGSQTSGGQSTSGSSSDLAHSTGKPSKQADAMSFCKEAGMTILEVFANLLCEKSNTNALKKFVKAVTSKWLLHLLAGEDDRVVMAVVQILAKVLLYRGSAYTDEFEERLKGFTILRLRLKDKWHLPGIWIVCFAILFGIDVAALESNTQFNPHLILDTLIKNQKTVVVGGLVFSVITTMLKEGLIATSQSSTPEPLESDVVLLSSVISLLRSLHCALQSFRDFLTSQSVSKDLLKLFGSIMLGRGNSVSFMSEFQLEEEFNPFEINQEMENQNDDDSPGNAMAPLNVPLSSHLLPRSTSAKRSSSYVIVTSDDAQVSTGYRRFHYVLAPSEVHMKSADHPLAEETTGTICDVFIDQILHRKDFSGLGLFVKLPPGSMSERTYLATHLMHDIIRRLEVEFGKSPALFSDPVHLNNISRFALQTSEAIFEGWLLETINVFLRFTGDLLRYFESPSMRETKIIRLCSPMVLNIRKVFCRMLLLQLSRAVNYDFNVDTEEFLRDIVQWDDLLTLPGRDEALLGNSFLYMLYQMVISPVRRQQIIAIDLWRRTLAQKTSRNLFLLSVEKNKEAEKTSNEFMKLVERSDNDTFLHWLTVNRLQLELTFEKRLRTAWEHFVTQAQRESERTARRRLLTRRERLEKSRLEELVQQHTCKEQEKTSRGWNTDISISEHFKYLRRSQDKQDHDRFLELAYTKLKRNLVRSDSAKSSNERVEWQLDEVEGRDRMRLRLIPEKAEVVTYKPKRRQPLHASAKATEPTNVMAAVESAELKASSTDGQQSSLRTLSTLNVMTQITDHVTGDDNAFVEEDFELVPEPGKPDDDVEDKNRKVMRNLRRGEKIRDVYNITCIRGLEACETLLVMGNTSLYLMDRLFQRSDGEIVNCWQAPAEERDLYVQIISGQETDFSSRRVPIPGEQTRHWLWLDILSISKRHFLLRDVAMEVFFADGQSCLLTAASYQIRDSLYQALTKLITEAKSTTAGLADAQGWRLNLLRNPHDSSQTIASRFINVFNNPSTIPATKEWIKGEISNFHYLMRINTLAGRTYNDLTQYPVFPWVLSDYTSDELDLSNPRVYRDLSKPMGCQTPRREATFRDRYRSFAEMGDERTPAFHYGTHYSSAMIVTGYLIRLQPFASSYLLLQGGNFDHADRLFDSLENAWLSASGDTMSDVRELTPEFFYLPDFLENVNGYDFGRKQGSDEVPNHVKLPPWAKGDPSIFIAKNREALESPFVSQQLHLWIDLIFGSKQRGEAAIEATNVFHHLSYHGAKDLDTIEDRMERLATIGIIHNFGQTPRQVFSKPHEQRQTTPCSYENVLQAMRSLTQISHPLADITGPASSLQISPEHRLLYWNPFHAYSPSKLNMYAEWGNVDQSLRFYTAGSKKPLGIFEQPHTDHISVGLFVDAQTLVTASYDATISVWAVTATHENVQLQLKDNLFRHRQAINILAVSQSNNTLLSASTNGQLLLWDLNSLELIRRIPNTRRVNCAQINDTSGHILFCCDKDLYLYTLNGRLILRRQICNDDADRIVSCAFYEDMDTQYMKGELILTGHKRGIVNIWSLSVSKQGSWQLELVNRLKHNDRSHGVIHEEQPAVTSVLAFKRHVYTGDQDGRVGELIVFSFSGTVFDEQPCGILKFPDMKR